MQERAAEKRYFKFLRNMCTLIHFSKLVDSMADWSFDNLIAIENELDNLVNK